MGSFDCFYTALSGMQANTTSISVVGDNLANLNTVGFKSSRASFQDILGQSLVGSMGSKRMGQGVSLKSIDQLHTQGGLESTGRVTDLAIAGNGFFMVKDQAGGADQTMYTRAGQFLLDQQGFLVTPSGMRLQGYTATEGVMGTALGDIELGGLTSPARGSSEIDVQVHLPADQDPEADPYTSEGQVYDSLGRSHAVEITYTYDADGVWNWTATSGEPAVEGDSPPEVGSGTISFDANGAIDGTATGTITLNPGTDASDPQDITINFGAAGEAGASTYGQGPFASKGFQSDGRVEGELESINIRDDGSIEGTFSNGTTEAVAQVALAVFDNVQGLQRQGGGLFAASPDSGQPTVGAAGTGPRGNILSNHLETSNVDMTREFVNLITAQRGFQAASRTITTADQLLAEAIQLKR